MKRWPAPSGVFAFFFLHLYIQNWYIWMSSMGSHPFLELRYMTVVHTLCPLDVFRTSVVNGQPGDLAAT